MDNDRSDAGICELTILMPCLNEARTVGFCVRQAREFLESHGVAGEVLIADNGSTDGSQRIAEDAGARVVPVAERGYGAALRGGIAAARGRFVIMGDCDASYDFAHLMPFVEKLRGGAALVMGNRFKGGIAPGAMPPLHRYFGNPVLSALGRMFFRSPVGDIYCGLRGFDRAAIARLDLAASGMEFACEMVVKATLGRLPIAEVPTTLVPDGRGRRPHLRSFRDGWRTLRFFLLLSPRWLFLYPGLILLVLGLAGFAAVIPAPLHIGSVTFDVHTLLIASLVTVLGVQAICFAALAKSHAVRIGVLPDSRRFGSLLAKFSLEWVLVAGVLIALAGIAGIVAAIWIWRGTDFGGLDPSRMMRLVVPAATAVTVGVQVVFAGFLMSILALRTRAR